MSNLNSVIAFPSTVTLKHKLFPQPVKLLKVKLREPLEFEG